MPDSSQLPPPTLWLISGSPRRLQILQDLGFQPEVKIPQVEEPPIDPDHLENALMALAEMKVESCLPEIPDNTLALGADTIVTLDNKVLGKPKDREEAERFLRLLSGRRHQVQTAIHLFSKELGSRSRVATTEVQFRTLSPLEIANYLKTPEPYDKAGGYAVQGLACRFVDSIQGSYTNVVGLPAEIFLEELEDLTDRTADQWLAHDA